MTINVPALASLPPWSGVFIRADGTIASSTSPRWIDSVVSLGGGHYELTPAFPIDLSSCILLPSTGTGIVPWYLISPTLIHARTFVQGMDQPFPFIMTLLRYRNPFA